MSVPEDRGQTPLETLLALLETAREFASKMHDDPQVERILAAFARVPASDRDTILGIIERDATWCRIVEQTADTTGIAVRPNPQASLYVHVVGPQGKADEPPLRRDVDMIRFGIEQFVPMLPLFFQEGVHAQWTASARELIADAGPELREIGARLCREILALIEDAGRAAPSGQAEPAKRGTAPATKPRFVRAVGRGSNPKRS
jgi:hypothetical protein